MNVQRRRLLQMSAIVGVMASAGLMTQAEAAAWNKAAFEAKSIDDVAKVFGGATPTKSDAITLRAPDIAAYLLSAGAEPVGLSPEQMALKLREEIARWAKVVKAANMKVD